MRIGSWMRPALAAAVTAVAIGAAAMPALARDPAVSTVNLKVTAEAGPVEDEGSWLGIAGLTAPLSQDWGVQGEAGVFGIDGDPAYGLAGHVFTRDPAQYLAGAFAAWAHEDDFDLDVARIGLEGEYYLEHLTLLAKGGYQFGDGPIDDTFFGEAQVSWYANEDFALTIGAEFDEDIVVGHFGAEWLIGRGSSLPGLALRGDIYQGDNSFDSVMGGVTYYFGTDANLMDRHRKQDPDSALFDLFQSIGANTLCQAPPIILGKALDPYSTVCTAPPPPPPS